MVMIPKKYLKRIEQEQPIILEDKRLYFKVSKQDILDNFWFDLCFDRHANVNKGSLPSAMVICYCSFDYAYKSIVLNVCANYVFMNYHLNKKQLIERLLRYSAMMVNKMGINPKNVEFEYSHLHLRNEIRYSPSSKRFKQTPKIIQL